MEMEMPEIPNLKTQANMSDDAFQKLLRGRSEFIKHLKEDLNKNDEGIEAARKCLEDLKMTSSNVKELSKKVEHQSMIPLGKNIYVNATMVHTGEYFLDKRSYPNSYSVLETTDGTLKLLENKITKQAELLQQYEDVKKQLEERLTLLQGCDGNDRDDDLPKEIVSDKGVAVRVGEFYEIVEFEN